MQFEYKVVPAPNRGKKAKGVKSGADRFALAMTDLINELAAEGWEYQRSDTLPAEERSGLTGKTTVFQNMLIFRRPREVAAQDAPARPLVAPVRADQPVSEDIMSKDDKTDRKEPTFKRTVSGSAPTSAAPIVSENHTGSEDGETSTDEKRKPGEAGPITEENQDRKHAAE